MYGRIIGEKISLSLVICASKNPLLCTLIILAKRYIYECRYNDTKLDVRVFKRKVNYIQNTKFEVAKRNGKMLKYIDKWEPLIEWLKIYIYIYI